MQNELSKKTYPDGTEVYFRDDTAREQIATIHPNATTLQSYSFVGGNLSLSGPDDKPIRMYETGDEDYKSICIYDKNNVERYVLLFSGGHLRFTSKNASGTTIVNQLIV